MPDLFPMPCEAFAIRNALRSGLLDGRNSRETEVDRGRRSIRIALHSHWRIRSACPRRKAHPSSNRCLQDRRNLPDGECPWSHPDGSMPTTALSERTIDCCSRTVDRGYICFLRQPLRAGPERGATLGNGHALGRALFHRRLGVFCRRGVNRSQRNSLGPARSATLPKERLRQLPAPQPIMRHSYSIVTLECAKWRWRTATRTPPFIPMLPKHRNRSVAVHHGWHESL